MFKSYAAYMDEITPDELYKGLLSQGLFTEKLPPIFTSIPFYDYCISNKPTFLDKDHDYIAFNSMRNVNIPRQLGIPTPMAYERLCAGMRDYWCELQKHFHDNTDLEKFKISRIHIRKQHNSDMLFKMNYEEWRNDPSPEDDIIIGKRCLVKADISTCFPSIYTHSIPWALVGKDTAKIERNSDLWFNKIDHLCQKLRNGETHGLLIGPHASNVVSELILTVVDNRLAQKGWEYVRKIDDYSCYVSSADQAQHFLIDLETELRYFDLVLNYKKTSVNNLPLAATKHWVRKLNSLLNIERYGIVDYIVARSYFDGAIELMSENVNDTAIINYAIKVLAKKRMSVNAKKYCSKECMHLALIYPYLFSVLENFVFKPYNVSKVDIKHFAELAYNDGIHSANYEEACYAIYFSLRFGFELNLNTEVILATDSCMLKLFAMLYYRARDTQEWRKYRDHAKKLKALDVEMDRNWIFIYETLTWGNLKGEWKNLKKANVSFIKPELFIELKNKLNLT